MRSSSGTRVGFALHKSRSYLKASDSGTGHIVVRSASFRRRLFPSRPSARAGTFHGGSQRLVDAGRLSSCRLYLRSIRMFPTRLRPNVALIRARFLLAKSGVDDQDESNQTAVRPNRAALATTRIFHNLTYSRKSLTDSALCIPIPHHLELAYACRS